MKTLISILLKTPILRSIVASVLHGVLQVLHKTIQEADEKMETEFKRANSIRDLAGTIIDEVRGR